MPLDDHIPRIDDRRYDDIIAEVRTRIARYTPEWAPRLDRRQRQRSRHHAGSGVCLAGRHAAVPHGPGPGAELSEVPAVARHRAETRRTRSGRDHFPGEGRSPEAYVIVPVAPRLAPNPRTAARRSSSRQSGR